MNYIQHLHQGVAPGRSMANGGGGGSSGPDNYANLEKLYGEQARAAQFMLDQSMPMLPGTMQNTAGMTQDAMSGALGNRMRRQAEIDADAASGDALTTMNQNLAGYGVNPNSGLFAGANRKLAVSGAANKVGAMNQAGQWSEDQKWNRNAGQFSQLSGMGDGAMQGLSSAAGGYSNMAAQQSNKDMANAKGFGQFGSALAGGLMKKADGGYIEKPVKMASGGDVWTSYKAANPVVAGKRKKLSTSDQLAMVAAGAAPHAFGYGLKAAWNSETGKDIRDSLGQKLSDVFSGKGPTGAQHFGVEQGATYDSSAQAMADRMEFDGAPAYAEIDTPNMADPAMDIPEFEVPQVEVDVQVPEWDFAFADGGSVRKHGLRLAMGGRVFNRMPGIASMDASKQMKLQGAGSLAKNTPKAPRVAPVAQAQTNPVATGTQVASSGKKLYDGIEAAEKVSETSSALDAAMQAGESTEAIANAADAASKASDALDGSTGGNPATAALKLGVDLASGRDAGTAVADAAATYGGAELGATAGTAILPGVGTVIGGLLGGLAGGAIFADGGDVQGRKDMTEGGKVTGPGTETSDDIPAWLSDGEYVLNAEAVKLAGKENLEKINDAGLVVRYGDADKREAMVKAASGLRGAGKKGVKLAGGGYLGVALGSGVQQFERQKAAQREDERFKQQQAMQERQMKMSEAAAARQEAAAQRLIDKENKIEGVQAKAAGYIEDANAIAGFDTGHMTPEEKSAAGRAYSEAGYSPEALRSKATGAVGAQNLVAGMQLNDMLRKQEQDRRRGAVGQAMAGGDIGGAISNAGGDWTQQGFGLSILGSTTDKRTGAKTITIGKEGKPVAAIDASLLGDFTESLIDPSKAPAFSKEQRSLENMYRDDERANKSLAIQGGSAALSNRLNKLKISEAEQLAQVNAKVRDLRIQLAETKDPAVAEELKRQIMVYEGAKADRDLKRYTPMKGVDSMGREVSGVLDTVTKEWTPTPVVQVATPTKEKSSWFGGGNKNATKNMDILPPPVQSKQPVSYKEYAAQIRARNPGRPIPDDVLRAEYNKRAGG